jgi:hypothetical protein
MHITSSGECCLDGFADAADWVEFSSLFMIDGRETPIGSSD